jgi:hypothetical protein
VRRTCSTHGEKINVCRILVRKPKERDYEEDLDVGGRIMIR